MAAVCVPKGGGGGGGGGGKNINIHGGGSDMDSGKYVRYTQEQVEALERVYSECPKPSSLRRNQLIRECTLLSNIEPKQIKVWFQNRRCREKQRKEASRLQTVNRKLTAMNKLLMEENDRLQKQVSQLVYQNGYMKQQLQNASVATTDTSCESVVTSSQHQQNPAPPQPPRDANSPAGLLSIAEETLAEFLSKATGTAVGWVQMVGMKPGPDSIGIVAVSHNCPGVAARACGLVSLEPSKVAEILKDRMSWYRDCRCLDVLTHLPTGNGGTIELLYMQTYAPTTLAAARDFWTLRYTTSLEDGSLVICERSLNSTSGCPSANNFVRAEMHPSGYLIRPCEGGGSIIHIVDHVDLDAWSVPEVLRPLYESPKILAQKMTLAALHHIRQIAHETSGESLGGGGGGGRQPAVLRTFSQRLSRGFHEAVNGFADDGWSIMNSDGVEDVTIVVNSSPNKLLSNHISSPFLNSPSSGVLCAKASMLLQNVPPAILVRFLREHRSEWADASIDAYSAATLRATPYAVPGPQIGGFPGGQVAMPLAHTLEKEELLEIIRLEGHSLYPDDGVLHRDTLLLQLCSGIDENAVGSCAQLVFAHIDESFSEDALLLPSGFRVIPLESKTDVPSMSRTLDLASTLEVGSAVTKRNSDTGSNEYNQRSVLTIAFQFPFENHLRDNVAVMARQYVRNIVASVQRVAMAIAPSRVPPLLGGAKSPPGTPEAVTLALWICRSYRAHAGVELLLTATENQSSDAVLKLLWHHQDAIMCCSLKTNGSPVFTFANQAGLDMLETTLVALQDLALDKILDETGRKALCSEFPKIMQQGLGYVGGGLCLSSMSRPVSYDQIVAWKVLNEEDSHHCLAFMFINWSFV